MAEMIRANISRPYLLRLVLVYEPLHIVLVMQVLFVLFLVGEVLVSFVVYCLDHERILASLLLS